MVLSAYERSIRRFHRQLLREETATRRLLAQAYEDAAREIRRRTMLLLSRDVDDFRLVRLRALERQIEQEIQRLVSESVMLIADGQRAMARLGPEQAAGQIAAQVPGLETSFSRLPRFAFETMVGALADGTPLRALLLRYGTAAANKASRILRDATAIGQGPQATARELRRALGALQWEAERIARTEQIRVYRESSRLSCLQNPDIVRGYRRLAAHDRRTCPVCLALDGTMYRSDRLLPSHPNCRCGMVPVLHEQFGALPPLESGVMWFGRQSADVQRQMLGPGKFALFSAGEISLRALVHQYNDPIWGPQVREVPLSVLDRRRRQAA